MPPDTKDEDIIKKNGMPSVSEIKVYKNIDEFDANLPKTVELLRTDNGDKIYVIGTAHFSRASQKDVSIVMRNTQPSAVVLELCPLRLHILQLDEKTLLKEALDLGPEKVKQILAEQGVASGMFYLSFLKTNADITRQMGMAPGGECRRAVAEAKLIPNCRVLLGDRPLDITLSRAMAGLTFAQKLMLSVAMNSQKSDKMKITEAEVEKFKERNTEPLKTMKDTLPSVYRAFVSERDIVLAHSLLIAVKFVNEKNQSGQPKKIVGVVGMGHMNGIIKNFGNTSDQQISKLMVMGKKHWFGGGGNINGKKGGTSTLMNLTASTLKYWPKIKNFFRFK